MFHLAFESTSPTELGRAREWRDRATWLRLLERHDPLIQAYCRLLRLTGADADEVRQETWIAVAKQLPRFRYDPRQSFRKWLWTICRSKAADLYRTRSKLPTQEFDDWMAVAHDETEVSECGELAPLFAEAARVQAAVRDRVEPRTWEAFWLVDVQGWTRGQVAAELGMSLASVYKAVKRVRAHLRDEGAKPSPPVNGEPKIEPPE